MHDRGENLSANFPASMDFRMDVHVSAAFENGGALGVCHHNTPSEGTIGPESAAIEGHQADQHARRLSGGGRAVNMRIIRECFQAAVANIEVQNIAFQSEAARPNGRSVDRSWTFRSATERCGKRD